MAPVGPLLWQFLLEPDRCWAFGGFNAHSLKFNIPQGLTAAPRDSPTMAALYTVAQATAKNAGRIAAEGLRKQQPSVTGNQTNADNPMAIGHGRRA